MLLGASVSGCMANVALARIFISVPATVISHIQYFHEYQNKNITYRVHRWGCNYNIAIIGITTGACIGTVVEMPKWPRVQS